MSKHIRRCRLIVNPRSGTSEKGKVIKKAIEQLLAAQWNVEAAYTERPGHATELAAQAAADGFDAAIAVGGDGTVNETAKALVNSSTALGIIPMGSGNGLARHMNIPMNPFKAIEILSEGNVEECDYCTVNNIPFFCTFGMGFDAAVADRFAATPGNRGFVNYLRSTFLELIEYKPESYTIYSNNETIAEQAFVVACCNAAQYGNNAFIAPNASITDGLMDVTIIHNGNILSHALSGIDMMIGTIHENTRIHTFRTAEVTIERSGNGPVQIDGEPTQMGQHLTIRCHHKGIRVISPGEMKVKPILSSIGL